MRKNENGGSDASVFALGAATGAVRRAEIRRGVREKPKGKKRALLEAWFAGSEGPQALFAGRVLPFDEKAGLIWAQLMADGTARGRPRSALVMIVAAVAEANGCVISACRTEPNSRPRSYWKL